MPPGVFIMLNIQNLSLNYEGRSVFQNVNLEFRPGTINVVTGLSGCGKTSFLKLLNGIIPEVNEAQVEGSVTYGDHALLEEDMAARSRYLSTVFQNPKTQFYCINSSDELAFGLENRNIPREEILSTIAEYTKLLHTEDLLNRDIFSMSGGEKQLLAITAVACMDNDIYLFDEPSASLDRTAIRRFTEVLKILKQRNKIVIIAEHRLYYLKDLMDSLLVLDRGQGFSYTARDLRENGPAIQENHHLRSFHEILRSDLPEEQVTRIRLVGENQVQNQGDNSVLQCRNFELQFDGPILDLSIDFRPGIYFIIGENGVGKSTIVKRLCRLNKGKGKKYYHGKAFRHPYGVISAVMQDVNYQIFTESCREELAVVQGDEAVIDRCLEEVSLLDKKDVHPQLLSGGEKQRLLIAKTRASGRPVVILDEPTSGLDKLQMEKMAAYLEQFRQEGRTVLIITHDNELIQSYPANILVFVP